MLQFPITLHFSRPLIGGRHATVVQIYKPGIRNFNSTEGLHRPLDKCYDELGHSNCRKKQTKKIIWHFPFNMPKSSSVESVRARLKVASPHAATDL